MVRLQNAYRVQLRLFLADVQSHLQLPGLRAALALYSTISLPRLASLLDTSETALRCALGSIPLSLASWGPAVLGHATLL